MYIEINFRPQDSKYKDFLLELSYYYKYYYLVVLNIIIVQVLIIAKYKNEILLEPSLNEIDKVFKMLFHVFKD